MKKKILSVLIISAMLLSSAAVMAEENTAGASGSDAVLISTEAQTDIPFVSFEQLTVVGNADGMIETTDENGGTTFFKMRDDIMIYEEDGTELKAEDIKEGDIITAYVRSNEPAPLIFPPQYTPAVIIRDKADYEGLVKVSNFTKTEGERAYISAEGDLVVNLPEDFIEARIMNNDFLVFYTMTTRSIPPQTTPDKLLVIPAASAVEEDEDISFTDVPEDYTYCDSIKKAVKKGLFKGVSDKEFAPEGSLTRAMMVTILGRMDGIAVKDACVTGFEDTPGDQYYSSYVAWANENKIVQGYGDGTFQPNKSVTNEEAMIIVRNYCNYKGIELDEEISLEENKLDAKRGEITFVVNEVAEKLGK